MHEMRCFKHRMHCRRAAGWILWRAFEKTNRDMETRLQQIYVSIPSRQHSCQTLQFWVCILLTSNSASSVNDIWINRGGVRTSKLRLSVSQSVDPTTEPLLTMSDAAYWVRSRRARYASPKSRSPVRHFPNDSENVNLRTIRRIIVDLRHISLYTHTVCFMIQTHPENFTGFLLCSISIVSQFGTPAQHLRSPLFTNHKIWTIKSMFA